MMTDPVCGMSVDPATAKGGSHRHEGKPYYFCNPRCRDKFIADPGKYLSPRPEAAPVAAAEWTCPMHPEIVRDQPGSCPICGMALEPRMMTGEEPPNPELIDMTRRFWASMPL